MYLQLSPELTLVKGSPWLFVILQQSSALQSITSL